MLKKIRQLWSPKEVRPLPEVPPGERLYAIGDIHGRLDLLTALAAEIEADDAARGPAETTIVLLGDLIDRGPASAEVLAFARDWRERRAVRLICGNHEEKFLQSFDDLDIFRNFLRYGGDETILSYPVDAATFRTADFAEAQALMIEAVPGADIEFIGSFEDFVAIGDYLFVHAGIRPGTAIEAQSLKDLRWIREPFLSHSGWHGHMVVHGHSISAEPEMNANRIGIDTGAYMSGRLTALALEGGRRWLIETAEHDGAISVATREA
ncbi:metallophosphoesterase [Novosphingobium sp. G106]|uniref:metallophosphoesterase n=1 Tax=Novosphingobium sp. G106 TaxID=2849500 RepID=UPI001C2DE42A|nr:metallophosphoesterase [Novosphingobium sp. G106]MBV1688605.1 metallophosphoesterase [Novosphingobium sp. G106]